MARQADLDKEPIDEPPPPVEIEAVEIDAGAAADQAAAEEALKEMAVVDSPFSEEEKVALVQAPANLGGTAPTLTLSPNPLTRPPTHLHRWRSSST